MCIRDSYKDVWIVKTRKNGGVEWEKTHGGTYMEMANDIAPIKSGGYMLIGNKCAHLYDIGSCGQKAKVLIMQIDEEGNNLNDEVVSGLNGWNVSHIIQLLLLMMVMLGPQNIRIMVHGFTKPLQMQIHHIYSPMDLVDLKSIIQQMEVLL